VVASEDEQGGNQYVGATRVRGRTYYPSSSWGCGLFKMMNISTQAKEQLKFVRSRFTKWWSGHQESHIEDGFYGIKITIGARERIIRFLTQVAVLSLWHHPLVTAVIGAIVGSAVTIAVGRYLGS
jgi:hypothetical protein